MLTQEYRDHAADLGADVCEDCQSLFLPVPGYVNGGHQCNSDSGLEDRYYIGEDLLS
ncbi:hypothetical protein ABZ820_33575 [Streptomyces diacarni]|uniref:hypothetical protein n=1 Tax=Streptomyces diacarni TaxID=2800381 RepID=UPI0033D4BAA8